MGLARDFTDHVVQRGFFTAGDRILVGVSGGVDSLALLHLLKFSPGLPDTVLVVGHLDHCMRAESDADALWVRGWAEAWGLECRLGQVEMAHHQPGVGQPGGEPEKMEQSQRIHPAGNTDQDPVAGREEPTPCHVVREVAGEPDGGVHV